MLAKLTSSPWLIFGRAYYYYFFCGRGGGGVVNIIIRYPFSPYPPVLLAILTCVTT